MKLLLDENLSPKLVLPLQRIFPGSAHVRECGLVGQPDEKVWDYARREGFTIVTKDADFEQRSYLYGHPPKVVWLRVGNCTRQELLLLITHHEWKIRQLAADLSASLLKLS